jgi:hypothetical protein
MFTHVGIQHLQTQTNLKTLWVNSCNGITDECMEPLSHMTALKTLMLSYCSFATTDKLYHLTRLTNLKKIGLSNLQGKLSSEEVKAMFSYAEDVYHD